MQPLRNIFAHTEFLKTRLFAVALQPRAQAMSFPGAERRNRRSSPLLADHRHQQEFAAVPIPVDGFLARAYNPALQL
jgi:hypothetical protein